MTPPVLDNKLGGKASTSPLWIKSLWEAYIQHNLKTLFARQTQCRHLIFGQATSYHISHFLDIFIEKHFSLIFSLKSYNWLIAQTILYLHHFLGSQSSLSPIQKLLHDFDYLTWHVRECNISELIAASLAIGKIGKKAILILHKSVL